MPPSESYRTGPTWPPVGATPANESKEDLLAQLAQARAEGENLVGLPLGEAVAVATSKGFAVRLAREDDTEFVMSADLNFRRINLDVLGGRVVATSAG